LVVTPVEKQRGKLRRISVLIFGDEILQGASVVEGSDFAEVVTLLYSKVDVRS
jgi:hypothetical protein